MATLTFPGSFAEHNPVATSLKCSP